ncbi:MAG: acyl-CoA reductase [Candidatus Hodarchaeales archaeon]
MTTVLSLEPTSRYQTGEGVLHVPFVVRGEVIEDYAIEIQSRDRGSGRVSFLTPDLRPHLRSLVNVDPLDLKELADIPCREIMDILHQVGRAFQPGTKEHRLFNPIIEDAIWASAVTSNLTEPQIRAAYAQIPMVLNRDLIQYVLEQEVGIPFLDGWTEVDRPSFAIESAIAQQAREQSEFGIIRKAEVRAFPSRTLHILAGNVPLVAALSIMRGAAIKGHNLFKLPSNDLYAATTILRILAELYPDHPLTKQQSAVYWKGGDAEIEQFLYRPQWFQKIVAWGGRNGIQHLLKRGTVGMELITFDPKLSISILGKEIFANRLTLTTAVERAALDILAFNQEACVSSRYHFVEGTEEQVTEYCETLYDYLRQYAEDVEANPYFPPDLRTVLNELDIAGIAHVWGGEKEGAVVLLDEPMEEDEFFPICRTAAVTRVNHIQDALQNVNVTTQTIGIYPNQRKAEIRDGLIASGGQRIVSLGGAGRGVVGLPHDAFYPCHRMVRWAVDETY